MVSASRIESVPVRPKPVPITLSDIFPSPPRSPVKRPWSASLDQEPQAVAFRIGGRNRAAIRSRWHVGRFKPALHSGKLLRGTKLDGEMVEAGGIGRRLAQLVARPDVEGDHMRAALGAAVEHAEGPGLDMRSKA